MKTHARTGQSSASARQESRAGAIKVGWPEPTGDVERLARLREPAGPRTKIMMDANQAMNVLSTPALDSGAGYLDVRWFEEPISQTEYSGYECLRYEAGFSLAMREREFDATGLRELNRRDAITPYNGVAHPLPGSGWGFHFMDKHLTELG